MTQEEKSLLLKDLCARLPYGVKVKYAIPTLLVSVRKDRNEIKVITEGTYGEHVYNIEDIKPYLRPMSSMTDEELKEFKRLKQMSVTVVMPNGVSLLKPTYIVDLEDDGDGLNHLYDWLNAYHFDYRRLIEKGLALEASEGMYDIK